MGANEDDGRRKNGCTFRVKSKVTSLFFDIENILISKDTNVTTQYPNGSTDAHSKKKR
jgi:hypothetical protein